MANKNIVSGNMSLGNTLFKKVYFLAGVMMAANMFVVNEMKAMEIENMDINFNQDRSINTGKKASPLGLNFVLTYENYINLIGGLVFSGFNNYFKWWNYDAGGYRQFLWSGWRSKRFLNDIFQFDINLNWVRCVFWLIATIFESYKYIKGQTSPIDLTCTAAVIMNSIMDNSWINDHVDLRLFFFLSSLQGFISMPLAIHISNFSIAISLDSIIWELVSGLLKIVIMKNIMGEKIEGMMTDDNKVNKTDHYFNEEGDKENNKNN